MAHRVHLDFDSVWAHNIRDRDIDEKGLTATQEMLLFADDNWGEWRFDPESQKILFADRRLMQEYDRLVRQMLECRRQLEAEDTTFLAEHPQMLANVSR